METSQDEDLILKEKKKRGNIIVRQELRTLTPICDSRCSFKCFSLLFVFFLFFGLLILINSDITEIITDYTFCATTDFYCTLLIEIRDNIKSPIFVYYQLTDFYGNHRDYVRSRSYKQLSGNNYNDSYTLLRCKGAYYLNEVFNSNQSNFTMIDGNIIDRESTAFPCGLIAKSYFNDRFQLFNADMKEIKINENNISNQYDLDFFDNYNKSLQWQDIRDEHFIVWMQMETFNTFRKLWGKIEEDLEKGQYLLRIRNIYNITLYNSTKQLILTTTAPLGYAKVLGYILIVGAILSLFMAIIFFLSFIYKREFEIPNVHEIKWE